MTKELKNCKPKDREATEKRLLEAAKEVFSQHGYNGATTRKIAQKAEVNLALINRYFNGKYGLLVALLKTQNIAFRSSPLKYAPHENVADELCAYGEYVFDEYFNDQKFSKIVLGQFFTDEQFLLDFRSLFPESVANPLFVERLKLLQQLKKINASLDIAEVSSEIESAIFGFGVVHMMFNGQNFETGKKNVLSFLTRYSKTLA